MRVRRPGALLVLAGAALILLANLFAAAYVGSEHYIYSWDWAGFWLRFQSLGPEMLATAAAFIRGSGDALRA